MASQPTLAIVDAVSTQFMANYLACASLAYVIYDWVISLDEEISAFWVFPRDRKVTAAALLYGLSRYPPIIEVILIWRTVFPLSDTACRLICRVQFLVTIPVVLIPAIFSAIRVYALSPNNKAVAISALFLLFAPGLAINILDIIADPVVLPPPFNYSLSQNHVSLKFMERLSAGCRIITIAGDLLVLFVTWHKTYVSYRGLQRGVLTGKSIANVMLYNGSTYFIIITGANILQLIASVTPSAIQNPAGFAIGPLTAVLICRFLLDLRRVHRTVASAPSSASGGPSLAFAIGSQDSGGGLPAFIAAMGSEIRTGRDFPDPADGDEDGSVQADERACCEVGLPAADGYGTGRENTKSTYSASHV